MLRSQKIAILGYSFKTNSGDVRFSPIESFVEALFQNGCEQISVFDSTISREAIQDPRVSRMNSWQECVSGADCVAWHSSR